MARSLLANALLGSLVVACGRRAAAFIVLPGARGGPSPKTLGGGDNSVTPKVPREGVDPKYLTATVGHHSRRITSRQGTDVVSLSMTTRLHAESSGPSEEERPFETSASGLRWRDEIVGGGATPGDGTIVSVDYVGELAASGKVFDSSYERGQAFSFELGKRNVIPGMEEGVSTMKTGGKRTLLIPPRLAYGDRDLGRIPPNSELKFVIELKDVQSGPLAGASMGLRNTFSNVVANFGPNPFTFFVALFVLLTIVPAFLPDESPLMYGSPDVLKLSASPSSPLNADMDAMTTQ